MDRLSGASEGRLHLLLSLPGQHTNRAVFKRHNDKPCRQTHSLNGKCDIVSLLNSGGHRHRHHLSLLTSQHRQCHSAVFSLCSARHNSNEPRKQTHRSGAGGSTVHYCTAQYNNTLTGTDLN